MSERELTRPLSSGTPMSLRERWEEINEEYEESRKRLNKAGKTAAKHRKRIFWIEWVLIPILIGICGLVILEIVEEIKWIFG